MKLTLPLLCLAFCQFLSFGGLRAQCDPVQDSLALVALYDATDGPNWTDNTNWLVPGQPIGAWYGVEVDGDGCVTRLELNANQLSGSIPTELGSLSNLTILSLTGNQLSGSIPPEIGSLTNLTRLYLFINQLDGSIPPEIGNLVNLTDLRLWGNLLSGNIPPEIANLANLTDLQLNSNELSGSIPPEIGSLANLTNLSLFRNQLSGTIQPELGGLSSLTRLRLFSNQLSGAVPIELGSLSNLTQLELSGNQLSGSVPSELGNLSNLRILSLNSNQLSGSIPIELGSLSNLMQLELNANQLSGSIPTELGSLSNLTILSLTGNQLSGSIPPELGSLSNLSWLVLQLNQLSGSIPPELGSLSSLTWFFLNGNQLTGAIPPELGNLSNLTRFYLQNNQLEGCIPDELSGFCSLGFSTSGNVDGYNLTNNPALSWGGDFTRFCDGEDQIGATCDDGDPDTFDDSIQADCTCRGINVCVQNDSLALVALYNATDGPNWTDNTNWLVPGQPISTWYGIQVNGDGCVTCIDLDGNPNCSIDHIAGTGGNGLTGVLPDDLGDLKKLESLSLKWNNISGTIPSTIYSLDSLRILDLYSNNITGNIPSGIGNLINLEQLNLGFNSLGGQVPIELTNCTKLKDLWLPVCDLNGQFPQNMSVWPDLEDISIRDNDFLGDLPNELWGLSNLRRIIVKGNDWTPWAIPTNIDELVNLTTIDIQSANVTGTIPETLGNLPNLIVLFLGNNELTGCFPVSLMNHCDITTSFNFNPQLPWEGDFDRFCDGEDQIGATCDDGDPDTYNDVINPDCSCAGMPLNCDPVQDSLALADLYNATDGPNWTNTWDLSQPMSTWYGIAVNAKGCVSCIDLDGEPDCIGNTAPSAGNNLSGSLPATLGNMSALEQLLLGSNNLSGSIPPSLSLAMKLKELNLSYNALSGTLPPDIGDLCELETLNLSNNNLSGSLPAELANLYNIMSINLGENDFTGSFPVEYQVFCSIEAFESEGNGLPDFQAFCAEGEGSDFCPIGIDSLLCTDEWQAYLAAHACGGLCEDSLSTIVHTEVGTVAIKGLDFGYTWTICAAPGGAFQSTTQLWSCRSINIQTCVTGTDSSYCIRHFPIDTLSYVSAWDCSLPLPNCEPSSSTAESSTARVRIYPNPATDMLYVLHDGHQALREISLYSMVGQQVYHHAPSLATAHSYSIPISDLPPGLYALDLQIGDARVVRKVVVGR